MSATLNAAVVAVRRGALVVFPTDTVYGTGTRPDDDRATSRLFAAKRRDLGLALPVLASSRDELETVAVFDDRADRLSRAYWPGGLTLVLRRTGASRGWHLGGDGGTIGVRVPAHPLALALLTQTGPLAVSSANRSGSAPAQTCRELQATFHDDVAVYVCADEPLDAAASTVVDLSKGAARVLRVGDVDPADIASFLPDEGSLLDSGPR